MSTPPPSDNDHAARSPAFRADPSHRLVPEDRRSRAVSLLRDVPLFRDVPPHQLRDLARFVHVEEFAAGQEIIRMGEAGSTMYVVRAGRVNVVRDTPAGDVVTLATLGPGEFFGELSIFDSETRSATVVAVEDTELLTLGRVDIVRSVSHNPELALSLLKSLSARLRAADDRLATTEARG